DRDDGRVGDGKNGRLDCRTGGRGLCCERRRNAQKSRTGQKESVHWAPSLVVLARGRRFISSIKYSSVGALLRSKKTRPSIKVISTRLAGAKGWPLKMARSASF